MLGVAKRGLPVAKEIKGIKEGFLLVTGFLACPCHLPFLLPALAGLLTGTVVGSFIERNTGWLIALATAYFIGVLIYFLRGNKSSGTVKSSEALEHVSE